VQARDFVADLAGLQILHVCAAAASHPPQLVAASGVTVQHTWLWIPGDGDSDSEVMSIMIPK
jgi:hypothetical protein